MKHKNSAPHIEEVDLIKKVLPTWKDIDHGCIEFRRLSGLTNVTYEIKDCNETVASIVFKKFATVEGMFDRQIQNKIMVKASAKSIGPKCYFANNKFRIEEFVSGFNHPNNEQLKDHNLIQKIMNKVAQFHQIQVQSIKHLQNFTEEILGDQFLNRSRKNIESKTYTEQEQDVVNLILSYFSKEKLQQLREKLMPSSGSLVKLCHNDLNNNNILHRDQKIYLIDFEYAKYNYVAYDLANFLSQSCILYGTKQYPYFEFLDEGDFKQRVLSICKMYLNEFTKGQVDDNMINDLANDVEKCYGICNFYWAIWSPLNKNDEFSFGYMQHGKKRIERLQFILNRL